MFGPFELVDADSPDYIAKPDEPDEIEVEDEDILS